MLIADVVRSVIERGIRFVESAGGKVVRDECLRYQVPQPAQLPAPVVKIRLPLARQEPRAATLQPKKRPARDTVAARFRRSSYPAKFGIHKMFWRDRDAKSTVYLQRLHKRIIALAWTEQWISQYNHLTHPADILWAVVVHYFLHISRRKLIMPDVAYTLNISLRQLYVLMWALGVVKRDKPTSQKKGVSKKQMKEQVQRGRNRSRRRGVQDQGALYVL